MRRPAPLPSELAGRPFDLRMAEQAGVGSGRRRSSDLVLPFRGIRSPASGPASVASLCDAYSLRLRSGDHFSHVTAASLYGMPLPARTQADLTLHVTVIAPRPAPRMRGVIGHQLATFPTDLAEINGMPVSSPLETWLRLAPHLPLDDLVAVGDFLVKRQRPLTDLPTLAEAVDRAAGWRGSKRLRQALMLIRPGTDSPQETALRLLLARAGLPEPAINHRIVDTRGRFLALGDLVFPDHRVVVEYDGEHHFATPEQGYRDIDRIERLVDSGWRVIRFNRSHLARGEWMAAKVRQALAATDPALRLGR